MERKSTDLSSVAMVCLPTAGQPEIMMKAHFWLVCWVMTECDCEQVIGWGNGKVLKPTLDPHPPFALIDRKESLGLNITR